MGRWDGGVRLQKASGDHEQVVVVVVVRHCRRQVKWALHLGVQMQVCMCRCWCRAASNTAGRR